jgi:hypothetical protein
MKAEVRGNAPTSSAEADLGDALGIEIAQDWSANANRYRFEKRLEGAVEVALLVAMIAFFILALLAIARPL